MAKDSWIERQLKDAKREYDSWEPWKKEAMMREVERGLGRPKNTLSRTSDPRSTEATVSTRKRKAG